MSKRTKLKSAKIELPQNNQPHDRLAVIPGRLEIGILTITDPYGISKEVIRNDRGEWELPEPEQINVIQSFRMDPIGKMFARKQVRYAEYKAARDLQALHDRAQIGVIRAIDPGKECVDGGMLADVLTDTQAKAIKRIRAIERNILVSHGSQGKEVLNGVIVDKLTVEQIALNNNAKTDRHRNYWRALFKEVLHTLGCEMGTIIVSGLTGYRTQYLVAISA